MPQSYQPSRLVRKVVHGSGATTDQDSFGSLGVGGSEEGQDPDPISRKALEPL